mmetsp:Transcript_56016/g.99745  ORF Transcript_56016/g.99745 Transcript_56016/m.99745 type:complete len:94 (+) Transcript_56016:1218-1499(+)
MGHLLNASFFYKAIILLKAQAKHPAQREEPESCCDPSTNFSGVSGMLTGYCTVSGHAQDIISFSCHGITKKNLKCKSILRMCQGLVACRAGAP